MPIQSEPPSVLIVSDVLGDTRRYRSMHLAEQLQMLGAHAEYHHLSSASIGSVFHKNWDLLILQRTALHPWVAVAVNELQARGATILADFDDLIFDVSAFPFINSPDFVDKIRVSLYLDNMRRIARTLERVQGSLVSTDFLAEQVRKKGKPAWVHRNGFSFEMLQGAQTAYARRSNRSPETCVIGYASGTPTHNRDFELIKPALIHILRQYPHTRLHLLGRLEPGNGWEGLEERIVRKPLVPWRELPALLAEFDINIAPLAEDNPFSLSKSEIKWMEAAMVGVPTVASPTDAFLYAIRPDANGCLASGVEEWEKTLSRLVEEREFRETLGETARNEVLAAYRPVVRAAQLGETLNEVAVALGHDPFFSAEQIDPGRLEETLRLNDQQNRYAYPRAYEALPSMPDHARYALKSRGVRGVVLSFWVYFRRLIAPIFPFGY